MSTFSAIPSVFDRDLLVRRRQRFKGRTQKLDFLADEILASFQERLLDNTRKFHHIALQMSFSLGRIGGGFIVQMAAWLLEHYAPKTLILANTDNNTTGWIPPESLAKLQQSHPNTQITQIAMDTELQPFEAQQFDLVVHAFDLALCNDVVGALIQIRRSLKPDGLMLASSASAGSFPELRHCLMQAEYDLTGRVSPHLAPLPDIRDWGGVLQRAGFALPVVDSTEMVLEYTTLKAMLKELQAASGGNILFDRARIPAPKQLFLLAEEKYRTEFGIDVGNPNAALHLPLTLQLCHLSGWAAADSQPQPLRRGSAKTRLADALGVTEHKGV